MIANFFKKGCYCYRGFSGDVCQHVQSGQFFLPKEKTSAAFTVMIVLSACDVFFIVNNQ
jgi:hypothetical protein